MYTVRVSETNPVLANLMLERFGGPQGDEAAPGQAAMLRSSSNVESDPTTGADLGAGPGAGATTGETSNAGDESKATAARSKTPRAKPGTRK